MARMRSCKLLTVGALLVAALVLLAACGGGQGQNGGNEPQAGGDQGGQGGQGEERVVIGLAISTLNNPFFVDLESGAREAAQAAGVELVVLDAQDDAAKQVSQIEDLVTQGVDAIVINPTDGDAVVPAIEKANQAGIPVLTVDRGASGGQVAVHIASDNVAGGRMAGEWLFQRLGGQGKVIELEGIPGTSAARDRGKGFEEALAAFPGIQRVAKQPADFDRAKGLSVMENLLQAHPDVQGVFAHNDEMALGAIRALQAAGKAGQVVVVGFDAIPDALQAIEEGLLAATVAQQPAEMGRLGVEYAVKVVRGEQVPASVPVPVRLVTSENLSEFLGH